MILVMVRKDDGVIPVEVDSVDCQRVTELRQTFGDANVSVDGVPFAAPVADDEPVDSGEAAVEGGSPDSSGETGSPDGGGA